MTVNKQHQVFRALVEYVQPSYDELRKIFGRDVDEDYDIELRENMFEAVGDCLNVSRESRELDFVFFVSDCGHEDTILREMANVGLRPALYEEFISCFKAHSIEFSDGVIALGSKKRVNHWEGVATVYWDCFGWSLTLPVMGLNGTWGVTKYLAVRE
ncbi:MAG: hypothetical protein P1P90_04190 [Patescibacteria group bacterium]|nr:hypothetical protein [Patescibacteria group bacterium]